MTDTINYDPNIRDSTQTVRLTLGQWQYRAQFEVQVRGNCRGFDIFSAAIDGLVDQLNQNKHDPDNDEEAIEFEMTRPDGDILICEQDDEDPESWLSSMVMRIEIIGVTPEETWRARTPKSVQEDADSASSEELEAASDILDEVVARPVPAAPIPAPEAKTSDLLDRARKEAFRQYAGHDFVHIDYDNPDPKLEYRTHACAPDGRAPVMGAYVRAAVFIPFSEEPLEVKDTEPTSWDKREAATTEQLKKRARDMALMAAQIHDLDVNADSTIELMYKDGVQAPDGKRVVTGARVAGHIVVEFPDEPLEVKEG